MKKVRFWLETGFNCADTNEVVEYEDDVTEEEIQEDLETWVSSMISSGYGYVEDDD